MVQAPSQEELFRRMWNRVSQATGITDDSESGFAANIVRVLAAEVISLWNELEFVEQQTNISTAQGINLDSIGEFFGVTRRDALMSSTIGGPSSIVFTNNTGSTILIPSRTRVWSNRYPDLFFFTTGDLTISSGQEGYVDVIANAPGSEFNLPAEAIDSHSFLNSNVSVTNPAPIINGAGRESDENYRKRIQDFIYRKEGFNLTAIKSAVLEVPGVRDCIVLNMPRGTGTVDVLLYSYDKVTPQTLIDECQTLLESIVAAGVSARALAPTNIPIDVKVSVTVKSGAVLSNIIPAVLTVVRGYLDNLPIEDGTGVGTLIFNELFARVQQSHSDIVDSNIQITREGVRALRTNQTLSFGERFVSRSIVIT